MELDILVKNNKLIDRYLLAEPNQDHTCQFTDLELKIALAAAVPFPRWVRG